MEDVIKVNRCSKCMEEAVQGEAFCSKCGYVFADNANAESFCLRPDSIIGGRYLVGRMTEKSDTAITYMGYDFAENEKVKIREYFSSAASRDINSGSSVRWNVGDEEILNGRKEFIRETNKASHTDGKKNITNDFSENNTYYVAISDRIFVPPIDNRTSKEKKCDAKLERYKDYEQNRQAIKNGASSEILQKQMEEEFERVNHQKPNFFDKITIRSLILCTKLPPFVQDNIRISIASAIAAITVVSALVIAVVM